MLGMMDLALLLCRPGVWKGWALSACRPSMAPPLWRPSRGALAETVCWAALAVVPIVSRQSQSRGLWGQRVCGQGAGRKSPGGKRARPPLTPTAVHINARGPESRGPAYHTHMEGLLGAQPAAALWGLWTQRDIKTEP